MIENPCVGMKVVPSDELRSSIVRWISNGWYSSEVIDTIMSVIDCVDKNRKPFVVTYVAAGTNRISIDLTKVKSSTNKNLVFHPLFFDEYIKPFYINYERVSELI